MTTTINKTNFSFKNAKTRVLSIFMLVVMLFAGISNVTSASGVTGADIGINITNGKVQLQGGNDGEDIWSKIGEELANVIAALSGIATVVMVGMCLFNMTKVATAGTNAKARTEALQAVGWTLLAAVGLGSVTLWVALAMNTGGKISGEVRSSAKSITTVASVDLDTTVEELNLTM